MLRQFNNNRDRSHFLSFLKEYELVTGLALQHVGRAERPDFITHRSDSTELGIKLSKIIGDPQFAF
jgi:hypothetical protein